MSLRTRVALVVTATVVVGIALVSLVAFRSASTELTAETDRFLRERADEIVKGERPGSRDDDRRGDRRDDDGPLPFDADAITQTIDDDGAITASAGGTLPVDAIDVEVADGGRPVIRTIDIDGTPHRMLTQHIGGGGAVQVATAIDDDENVLDGLQLRLLAVGVAVAAIGALAAVWMMRRVTRPLEELTAATSRVAATQDLTPLGIERNDEVGRLARAFDDMLLALSFSRRQQRRLVQDAGHELRTPLTSLRANIEFLEHADQLPDDQRRALVAGLRSEVTELSALVDEVLALATDDTNEPIAAERFDLAAVAEAAATRFERRTGRQVTRSLVPSPVLGDARLVDRAITTLLGNAHKFGPGGSPIELTVDGTTVTVLDRGPGFDPDDVERVFDRFYRADDARSLPGSGLGLAIVQRVAAQHGGTASARNRPGGGAIVSFSLGGAAPASAPPNEQPSDDVTTTVVDG